LALGWFEAFKTPEERQKFVHAIKFYRQAQKSLPLHSEVQVQPSTPDNSQTQTGAATPPTPATNH
jgi:hypothetical protein